MVRNNQSSLRQIVLIYVHKNWLVLKFVSTVTSIDID